MRDFFRFLGKCLSFTFRRTWGVFDTLTTLLSSVAAILIYYWREQMSAEGQELAGALGGWIIPIIAAALVTLVRFLFSPYWVYQEVCKERDAALEELRAEQDVKLQKRRQAREECLERCVAALKAETITSTAALVSASAYKLESDDDIVSVCNELEELEYGHPFDWAMPPSENLLPLSEWRKFLRKAKLSSGEYKKPGDTLNFFLRHWQQGVEQKGQNTEPTSLDKDFRPRSEEAKALGYEQAISDRQRRIERFVDKYGAAHRASTSPTYGHRYAEFAEAGVLNLKDDSEVRDACEMIRNEGMTQPFSSEDLGKDILGFFRKAQSENMDLSGIGGAWEFAVWVTTPPSSTPDTGASAQSPAS